MALMEHVLDNSTLSQADSHWVKDVYNLAILSTYVTQPPNISKIIQLFSLNIWSLILISTLVITLFNTIKNFSFNSLIGNY